MSDRAEHYSQVFLDGLVAADAQTEWFLREHHCSPPSEYSRLDCGSICGKARNICFLLCVWTALHRKGVLQMTLPIFLNFMGEDNRTQAVSDKEITCIVSGLGVLLDQEVCVVVYDAGDDDPQTPRQTFGPPSAPHVVRVWLAAGHYTLLVPNDEEFASDHTPHLSPYTAQVFHDAEYAEGLQVKEVTLHQQVQSDKDLAQRLQTKEDLRTSGGGCAMM